MTLRALITRPEEDAAPLAAALIQRGIETSIESLLSIRRAHGGRVHLELSCAPAPAYACARIRPLVGQPVPAVTSTCSTSSTWLHDVPRIWRTASVILFIPWM